MKWPWSKKSREHPVIEHLQRRLVELVDDLKTADDATDAATHAPRLQRTIALFLELGHVYRQIGRPREEAQVKAQAAKFMLVLPARQEINCWAQARQLLREAIEAISQSDATSMQLADAHIVLAEFLSREAMEATQGEQRKTNLADAERSLRTALEIIRGRTDATDAQQAGAANIQLADLYNKLGNIAKTRAATEPDNRRSRLQDAEDFFTQALSHCSPETSADMFAITENNLGSIKVTLLADAGDEAALRRAGEHFDAALRVIERSRQPHLHAMVHSNLGELALTLTNMGAGGRFDLLQSALSHLGEALPSFPANQFPQQHAKILFGQGRALVAMGQKDEAKQLFKEALAYRNHLPDGGAQIKASLAEL